MPIYDYRCDHCGHAFSAVRGYDDPVITVCPSCGKTPRRLIVPPAIVFKGSGWYKTDSRPKPKDDNRGASPTGNPPGGHGDKPKSEGKPDATASTEAPKKSEAAS